MNASIKNTFLLKDIAEIRSGYLFRRRLDYFEEGEVPVIQLRDVSDSGTILYKELAKVHEENFKEQDFLKSGDVLFKAKTSKRVSAVFSIENEKVVVSSHYFILRLRNDSITPDYLAWFLNNNKTKQYFDSVAKGTRVPVVNKQELVNLSIVVPTVEKQKLIVDLDRLGKKESELLSLIKEKKEILISRILEKSLIEN